MELIREALSSIVLGIATVLVLIALAILPFLNPVWVGFEQGRAQAAAWTGFDAADLRTVTGSILSDLVVGPPDFGVTLHGSPVLNERERQHMRDVRSVFAGFYAAAIIGAAVLGLAFALGRRPTARAWLWRRLGRIGRVIAVGTVVVGLLGLLFFDTAFELFHELFFPPGSFLFDPRTDRLVQLFPETFWVETTIGVGIVVVALSLGLAWLGRRRAAVIEAAAALGPGGMPIPAAAR